ncbi:ribonuclease H-like YkuK family protein [Heliorestis acidaminivorans]|uniref:ribonuclease H-like YkuK family protein n=1 Tax=Heliorestis acidaminivorans TaxID=553427 RepID=UPI0014788898|nr:ribonuclease H-like YkuK family protein [Heliorestis acidaminivorans]
MLFRGQLGLLPLNHVVEAFQRFSSEYPDVKVSIWVGTDSQNHGTSTRVVTSVTAYRKCKGAQSYQYIHNLNRLLPLGEKLEYETHMSIEIIGQLRKILNEQMLCYELELHIDGGQKGKSRHHLQRVVGWAESMASIYNYSIRTKPLAFGASQVADRYAK